MTKPRQILMRFMRENFGLELADIGWNVVLKRVSVSIGMANHGAHNKREPAKTGLTSGLRWAAEP
jgi:hypothetical protein